MRDASEVVRQLICLAITGEELPEDEEAVTLWECMELYRILVEGETRARMGGGERAAEGVGPYGADIKTDAGGDDPAKGVAVPAKTANANKAATALKRETYRRLLEYREENGLGCFRALAEASGGELDEDTIRRMADGERFGIGEWRALCAALETLDEG